MSDEIKRYYDNKRASSKFKEGIAVWLYDPHKEKGISYSKVNEKLARPYVVTKCISDLVYHIQLGPNTKHVVSWGPGKAEVKLHKNKEGSETCEVTPSVSGKYYLDILWNEEHIHGSPFQLQFKRRRTHIVSDGL